MNKLKWWHWLIIIFVGLGFLGQFLPDEDTTEEPMSSASQTEDEPEKEVSIKERIEKELEGFDKPFDNSSFNGNSDAIQLELILFEVWAELIEKGEADENEETQQLAQQLKSKTGQIQAKEFPIMRQRYSDVLKDGLWENDIDVYVTGSKKNIINFTGGLFAANKNKKEFNDKFYSILSKFRFKKICYRWYKGQDDYTYWDIEVPNDKELVKL